MKPIWQIDLAVLLLAMVVAPGWSQAQVQTQPGVVTAPPAAAVVAPVTTSVDLTPYLQAELNEVALLTAQSDALRQQGDTMGADLLASYLPGHQAQADRLRKAMPSPPSLTGTVPASIGVNRQAMITLDRTLHQRLISQYEKLYGQTSDLCARQLGALGLGAATRDLGSLTIAHDAALNTPRAQNEAVATALVLEQAAVADLQTQAARLNTLGDTADADALLGLVPAHQQQIACLQAMVTQGKIGPAPIALPPTAPLGTRADILAAERAAATQMSDTYGLAVASLPAGSPLRTVSLNGQQIAQQALALPALSATV